MMGNGKRRVVVITSPSRVRLIYSLVVRVAPLSTSSCIILLTVVVVVTLKRVVQGAVNASRYPAMSRSRVSHDRVQYNLQSKRYIEFSSVR